jgi:hypothetical protein
MLSKCANPACGAKLHYLGDGKIYRMETEPQRHFDLPGHGAAAGVDSSDSQIDTQPPVTGRREYFWLCRECSHDMTLAFQQRGVVVVPIRPAETRAAAAS